MEEEDWEFLFLIPVGEEDIAEAKKKLCSRYHVEFQRREKRKTFIMIIKDYIQGECMQGYIETYRGTTEGKQIN